MLMTNYDFHRIFGQKQPIWAAFSYVNSKVTQAVSEYPQEMLSLFLSRSVHPVNID